MRFVTGKPEAAEITNFEIEIAIIVLMSLFLIYVNQVLEKFSKIEMNELESEKKKSEVTEIFDLDSYLEENEE